MSVAQRLRMVLTRGWQGLQGPGAPSAAFPGQGDLITSMAQPAVPHCPSHLLLIFISALNIRKLRHRVSDLSKVIWIAQVDQSFTNTFTHLFERQSCCLLVHCPHTCNRQGRVDLKLIISGSVQASPVGGRDHGAISSGCQDLC